MAKPIQEKEGKFWADKLMDLANLMSVALIFSEFTRTKPRPDVIIIGVALYFAFVILTAVIKKKL